jgi:ABC-type transport system involved in cytochrome c biogenesis permease subunit
MKFTWKSYWQPTPKGIRKIADSLLAGATLASTFAVMNDHPKLATWVMVISVVTKILSNFLTDDVDSTPTS